MEYELGQAAIAGNLYGTQQADVTQAPTPPPPTLVRALSSLDELNKRLVLLRSQAEEIAQAVGGPFPTNPAGNKAEGPTSSAMQRLNSSADDAHALVATIEHALGAIRRSLGA